MNADPTAITDAHVEATGAPRVFVHVFFNELPPGVAHSAGEIDTKISGIQGAIRAGRTLEIKQKLIKQIQPGIGCDDPDVGPGARSLNGQCVTRRQSEATVA